MFELIHELHTKLNDLKKFEAGYTSENHEEMLIKYNGKVIKLSLEEVGEGEITDHMRVLK